MSDVALSSEVERLIKDAEWRGEVIATLQMFRDKIKELDSDVEKNTLERHELNSRLNKMEAEFKTAIQDVHGSLARMSERINELIKLQPRPKLSSKQKIALIIALLGSVTSIVVEIIRSLVSLIH